MRHLNRQFVLPLAVAVVCASSCSSDKPSKTKSAPAAQPAATQPAPAPAKAAAPAAAAPTNSPAAVVAAQPTPTKEDNVSPTSPPAPPATFNAMKTTTLDGKPADLASYKGKVLLVVNTASQCGLTPQYAGLEKLHEELAAKNFSVLGFPSNDFGSQEPGTPAEIQEFCSTKYNVKFPLFSKVQTKAGEGQSPIYAWLGAQAGQLPRWNFGKYLIGKDGKFIAFFDSKVPPEDPALRKAIDNALAN